MSGMKDRDKAKQMYLESGGTIQLVDIAEQLGKAPGTVRGWKSRYKWDKELKLSAAKSNEVLQRKKRSVAEIEAASVNEEKAKAKEKEKILKNDKLTDKQQLFCVYYLKYFNATKAYQKAFQSAYATSAVEAHRLLKNPNISEEIERLKQERMEGIKLDSRIIMQQYIDIAFSDMTDFVEFGTEEIVKRDPVGNIVKDEYGNPVTYERSYVKFKDDAKVDGTILSEIGHGKNGAKVKLHDKMRALDWLAKNIPESEKLSLETELLKARIEKEKLQVEKVRQDLDADVDKPIEISIVSKKDRVGGK